MNRTLQKFFGGVNMTDVVGNMTNCAEFAADGSCKVNLTVSIAKFMLLAILFQQFHCVGWAQAKHQLWGKKGIPM